MNCLYFTFFLTLYSLSEMQSLFFNLEIVVEADEFDSCLD